MKSPQILLGFAKFWALGVLFTSGSLADEFGIQDGNLDGVLSGTEVEGLRPLDQDGDGKVSRREFLSAVLAQRQRAEAMVAGILKERDGNSDGRLSGNEISGLEDCDVNGDKRISELELRNGFVLRDASLQGKSFQEVRIVAMERFKLIDITENGQLSGTEAYGSTHFDRNVDGRISQDEYVLGLILSISVDELDADGNLSPRGDIKSRLNEVVSPLNNSAGFEKNAPMVPSGNDLPLPPDPMPLIPELDDGWIQTVSIRERVKFRMPGEATRTERSIKGRTSVFYDLSVPSRMMTFQLEVVALEADFSQHSDIFFTTYKNALLNSSGKELLDETIEAKAGFPLQVMAIKNPDGSYTGTLSMIDGRSLYHAHWNASKADKEDREMARKFLESIELIDAGGAPRTAYDPSDTVAPLKFPTTPPTPAPPAPR